MKKKTTARMMALALALLMGTAALPAREIRAAEGAAETVAEEATTEAQTTETETTETQTTEVTEETAAPETHIELDEGYREEFEILSKACEDTSWISLYKPAGYEMSADGSEIVFETTDLDGNPVKSEDIFSKNKITMVNIWGTFCGPCINEMPDLEVLNGRLADKGCAMIGIVCDVIDSADTARMEAAKEIIADTGVTYVNLIPWEGMDEALAAAFIPTTYFIDSSGCIVGEAAVGARGADEYEALLDEVLKTVE